MFQNKRKAVKKESPDARLKSKLKENFEWMSEDDTSLEDDSQGMGSGDLGDGSDDDMSMGNAGAGLDAGSMGNDATTGMGDDTDPLASLTPTQQQQYDTEIDSLLSQNSDTFTNDDSLAEADDDLMGSNFDTDMDVESNPKDITTDVDGMAPNADAGNDETVDELGLLTADDLKSIIASPDTYHTLENELIQKITNNTDTTMGDQEQDTQGLSENKDPWDGMKDLPGFEKEFQGEDVKDTLAEDVSLASSLKDSDFEEPKDPLNDKIDATVSDKGIRGGADSNVDDVNDKKKPTPPPTIAGADVMKESIKKSKMLVKAAAAILKLKQMHEAQQKEVARLKFENAKLQKVNSLFAVAGDKVSKEVRAKMVESFGKCQNAKEFTTLYNKVVNLIKESQKPSLNKAVAATKQTNLKPAQKINEAAKPADVKVEVSKEQQRRNYLMGFGNEDMYFDFQ